MLRVKRLCARWNPNGLQSAETRRHLALPLQSGPPIDHSRCSKYVPPPALSRPSLGARAAGLVQLVAVGEVGTLSTQWQGGESPSACPPRRAQVSAARCTPEPVRTPIRQLALMLARNLRRRQYFE